MNSNRQYTYNVPSQSIIQLLIEKFSKQSFRLISVSSSIFPFHCHSKNTFVAYKTCIFMVGVCTSESKSSSFFFVFCQTIHGHDLNTKNRSKIVLRWRRSTCTQSTQPHQQACTNTSNQMIFEMKTTHLKAELHFTIQQSICFFSRYLSFSLAHIRPRCL